MGLTLPYPGAGHESLDQSLSSLMKSLSLGNDYIKSTLRSVSLNGRDSGPALNAWGSGKLIFKASLSFNSRSRVKNSLSAEPRLNKISPSSPRDAPQKGEANYKNSRFAPADEKSSSPKHEAAVKLQKVYKSFRTRRQLADCAVLVEQRWWKLLDFAMLRRSSVSFFDIERTESALSKWSRAKSRAAKVGKGLSKDEKARKLALQHWLEAIDPRHRYGHNLHFYYDRWLRCEGKQPFFYWLDVGEGKEVSIDEKCPRPKLQQQCIKYLGPKEREVYEVIIEDGRLSYKKNGQILDTTEDPTDSKWIFVLSTTKNLYVGQKKKGMFQHSSFLAGGATSAAGRLEVEKGILKAIWPHSGHYRPTDENFQEFIAYLKSKNVDLADVKKSPVEGQEEATPAMLRPSSSEHDLRRRTTEEAAGEQEMKTAVDSEESEEEEAKTGDGHPPGSNQEDRKASSVKEGGGGPRLILRRMNFRKESLSLQLGNHLACRWTTGAGPRIGCVRDSPSELRFRALEEVSLSPRSPIPMEDARGSVGNADDMSRLRGDR